MTTETKNNSNKGTAPAHKRKNLPFIIYLAVLVTLLAAAVVVTRGNDSANSAAPSTTQSQVLEGDESDQTAVQNASDESGADQTGTDLGQNYDPEARARALAENQARWEMNHGR